MIRSVYENQSDILRSIRELYCPEGFDADLTFGNGAFWKDMPPPQLRFDIEPLSDGVVRADSTSLPVRDGSLSSVVFDPPFLTYVRQGREGNKGMVMARRFAGYWHYNELEKHYRGTLSECARILRKGGVLVFKCQDIIHNHRMHATHINVVQWASGFRLKDLFVLAATHRMPSPNRRGKQKHARIFHSYFLVLEAL